MTKRSGGGKLDGGLQIIWGVKTKARFWGWF